MKIRLYKKEDKNQVINLISVSLEEIFHEKASNLEDLEDIKNNFIKLWILEENNKIIGTVGIKNQNAQIRISRLYLKKSERGKGLGKMLMNKALSYCKKQKLKKIFLTTYEKMNSQGFYENIGFKVFKIEKDTGRIWMEKTL
jgi:N-acetylglutamate synthase-like GNAT family acetyltransferase